MFPSAFVPLAELPLAPTGRVDRSALPAPEPAAVTGGDEPDSYAEVAPRSATEVALAALWSELLELDRIGVHDGFFELGGHSLLATQLVSRVRELFQVELPLRALFETPTIAALAEQVEAAQRQSDGPPAPAIEPADRGGDLPLSFAQQRLWFLEQLSPGGGAYNLPAAGRLRGRLDAGAP